MLTRVGPEPLRKGATSQSLAETQDRPEAKGQCERRAKKPVISGLERVSKPGRRIYSGRKDIPWVLSGMGIAILSTPKGVMTGAKARKLGVGGEVLCKVW